ncbi:Ubiquitin carboxyl-terminal hydrolase 8-like [Oopsacas minuta]|uniref:Ubiquitin carboxyl-terminal hydrolase 8-like n=1 Tax=Oopsacas minuta TaxID=111878 RepID=A0AAV7KKF0_9METZ|nr:Ubiquitin carboxyl-terminal hydrolase 8-like [Oopsacas minuta]
MTSTQFQPIKYEYSPHSHLQQTQFQSFYHSTPKELQSPNLVVRENDKLCPSPKQENNKNSNKNSPIISPTIPHSKISYNQTIDKSHPTVKLTANNEIPMSPIVVTKSICSPTKGYPIHIHPNYTGVTSPNSKVAQRITDNADTILAPKTTPEAIKLRTFSTGTSTFNFWTNQIMRHIITPFSPANQKRTDGPCGLRNTGNICFMNSILQSFISLPLFKSRLLYFSKKGLQNFGAYSRLIESLTCYMLDPDSLVHDPTNIIRQICIHTPNLLANPDHYIVMQSQQDAGEFFLSLIELLNTAFQTYLVPDLVAREVTDKAIQMYALPNNLDFSDLNILSEVKNLALKNLENAIVSKGETYTDDLAILAGLEWGIYAQTHSTPLYELFIGQLVEARYCMSCQGISLNLETFTLLPLSIPDSDKLPQAIEEILEKFSRIEGLLGREKLRCTRCEGAINGSGLNSQTSNGLQDAQRRALITKLPEFLVIQLSRFHFDPILKFPYKNNKQISFPLKNLDMSQVYYESVVNTAGQSHLYELKSVVVHSNGSTALSGHYVAYTKISNRWYMCNDSIVTAVDMEYEKSTKQILENAYILFYGKQI